MKPALVMLAGVLPLAMTAAITNEPDIDLIKKGDLASPQNCKLTGGGGNGKKQFQIPCPGSEVGKWNNGATLKLVCKADIGGT
jgi:hypothetical protein